MFSIFSLLALMVVTRKQTPWDESINFALPTREWEVEVMDHHLITHNKQSVPPCLLCIGCMTIMHHDELTY